MGPLSILLNLGLFLPVNTLLESKFHQMDVLQLFAPSFASRHPHPLFHFGQSLEQLTTENPTQRTDHRQPSLNASGSTPCSAEMIQMIGVGDSWGRRPAARPSWYLRFLE